MITRIVITRASVPRVVAIASPTPSRGTRTGILGNLASSSSSSSSSSSRVPCPSPASVNSHCHRNPTQSRIPKTHYPRPSSSSSSWPRMTRAARARRGAIYIRTVDEVYRSLTPMDLCTHVPVRVHKSFVYVYTCFPYPSVRTRRHARSRVVPRRRASCPDRCRARALGHSTSHRVESTNHDLGSTTGLESQSKPRARGRATSPLVVFSRAKSLSR